MSFNAIITKAKNLFRVSSCYEIQDTYGWYSPTCINPKLDKQIFKTYYWDGFSVILEPIIKRTRASGIIGTGSLRLFRINWTKRYRDDVAALVDKTLPSSLPTSPAPVGDAASIEMEQSKWVETERSKWTGDRAPDPIASVATVAGAQLDRADGVETERCIAGSDEYFGWLGTGDVIGVNGISDLIASFPIDPEEGNVISAPTGIH